MQLKIWDVLRKRTRKSKRVKSEKVVCSCNISSLTPAVSFESLPQFFSTHSKSPAWLPFDHFRDKLQHFPTGTLYIIRDRAMDWNGESGLGSIISSLKCEMGNSFLIWDPAAKIGQQFRNKTRLQPTDQHHSFLVRAMLLLLGRSKQSVVAGRDLDAW